MTWYLKIKMSEKLKNNLCFFVDLDETLVRSEELSFIVRAFSYGKEYEKMTEEQKRDILDDNGFKIISDEKYEDPLVSKLRPGAIEFLSALSRLGKLYLCTSSVQDYADEVLNVFGLDGFFAAKYYRQNINGFSIKPPCNNFFLIDDLEFIDLRGKFEFLGAPKPKFWGETNDEYRERFKIINDQYSSKHIKVRPYDGSNTDTELSSVMGKINELVQNNNLTVL